MMSIISLLSIFIYGYGFRRVKGKKVNAGKQDAFPSLWVKINSLHISHYILLFPIQAEHQNHPEGLQFNINYQTPHLNNSDSVNLFKPKALYFLEIALVIMEVESLLCI